MRIQPQFHQDKIMPVRVITPCVSFSRDSVPGEQFASISISWWTFTAAIVIGWPCDHDFRTTYFADARGEKPTREVSLKNCLKCGKEKQYL